MAQGGRACQAGAKNLVVRRAADGIGLVGANLVFALLSVDGPVFLTPTLLIRASSYARQ